MNYEYVITRYVSAWTGTPVYYVKLFLDGKEVKVSEPYMTKWGAKRAVRGLAKGHKRAVVTKVAKGKVTV